MPDGQEKSDDLIAELAKLMASNAGSSEPEARPAPKLVTLTDNPRPEGQAPSPIRIPGMDAPTAPVAPATSAAPAAPPSIFRIPGMDQPLPAAPSPVPAPVSALPPAPAAPTPPTAMTPQAAVTPSAAMTPPASAGPRPSASIDFGTLPAASTFKPEPMSNWQDREIPKPVASRPVPAPVVAPPPPAAAEPAPASDPMAELEAVFAPPPKAEPVVSAPVAAPRPAAPALSAPMVAASQAAPATDKFDFDFGFDTSPPQPIAAPAAAPRPAVQPPAPDAGKPASGDPIADLIAAELDSTEAEEAAPAPAPRPFPQPGLPPAPRPQLNSAAGRGPAPQVQQSPAPRPEDRFGVAPVFGPTSKVQAPARPQPPVDPMDEIESLIGEAVRVELTSDKPAAPIVAAPAPTPAAQAAPVVPPLTAGFAPRRATIRDTEPQLPSAEAAILAAAAASGAEVGRIDSVRAEPSPYKRVKARPERRAGGMRQYVGMAVAGTLLLAAGLGLYWVLGMGRGSDTDAPVLQADATPVKTVPPPATTAPTNQGSVVFNELDGKTAPTDEQLVSRDDSEATSVADVATPVGSSDSAGSESELANRKVRTVTVRPDGTIVSGDEAVAGNEELPVDRPSVPDLPGADVQPSELLAAVPSGTAPDATAGGTAAAAGSTDVAALASTAPTPAANIDPTIVAPIPLARPADRSTLNGGANQRAAATQPAAQAADLTAPAATTGGSGPYVQLSSQPTQADAQNSLRATQNRLSGLLAGRSLAVRQVDLGPKGTWYRVVLPVDSFQEATQTCASLKANGVDCVPIGG